LPSFLLFYATALSDHHSLSLHDALPISLDMGLVNTVVPLDEVEDETVRWCEDIKKHSPTALRFLKAAMNADTDGLAGLQQMAGRSEEHTSELQSRFDLVCRLLLEKKKTE